MKTYIIHVSTDLEREHHIKSQLSGKDLDVTYINEGDKKDLSESVLNQYFTGNLKKVSSSTSCVYKHILAYERVIKDNADVALILEDDIIFYPEFSSVLANIKTEIIESKLSGFLISLEDSLLKYVNKSDRVKGQLIYPKEKGRLAGAYLIDFKAAKNMLELIQVEKCKMPMDWYHNYCKGQGILDIYWSQPTIALQGSLRGDIESLIDGKKHGYKKMIAFTFQRLYKKILYYLR